jgi:hypothetical protein
MAKKSNPSRRVKAEGAASKGSVPTASAAPVATGILVSRKRKKRLGSVTDDVPLACASTGSDPVPLTKSGGTGSDDVPL